MGDKIFTADRLPMLDPETKAKPSNLSETYGDLCLVADGFAQVYPEHKYLIVECLRELGYVSVFALIQRDKCSSMFDSLDIVCSSDGEC
jgi:hypothetical protein